VSKKNKIDSQEKTQFQMADKPLPEIDWSAIEAMEKKQHKPADIQVTIEESKPISYEEWYLMREEQINRPKHFKEILKVDARARGLNKKELVERWDWAARQFGLSV
jgi:predicted HTH transcriptional regulator